MNKTKVSSFASKRILVTGGAGAIGSHVTRQLSLVAKEILVVDNLSSGSLDCVPKGNVETMVLDIRDADKLDAIFQNSKIDVVVHLAAHFANQNSIEFPITDANVNINGTLALLQRCQTHGAAFVYASSSCVYGQKDGKLSEHLAIDDLHTPYAISKYGGELYTKFFAEHLGLPSIALRFFNNFGPFERPGRYRNVIPNFISCALQGQPIVITGSGDETRDFNYVANSAYAVELAAKACIEENQRFDVFNVGTGKETSILELAEEIRTLTNSTSEIKILGHRRSWDHTISRCADVTAISDRLGYKVSVGLKKGLSRTVEWFDKNPSVWQSK